MRKWFHAHADHWDEFKSRYFKELSGNALLIDSLRDEASRQQVTLLFAGKNTERNNATALAEYLRGDS